jgi:hypothetical protein
MIGLKIAPALARSFLMSVPNSSYRKGLSKYWRVDDSGHVRAQSVCWLFCWAKTGNGDLDAKAGAREIFDAILDTPFEVFDRQVSLEWAEGARYKDGDMEKELESLLNKKSKARR